MPILVIMEIPSNLLVFLISKPTTIVPFYNQHVDNYVYGVFGFANKYLHDDSAIVVFHDDDPHVLKEIKSCLETNGCEIHSRWVVINTLARMSNELKGKMVNFSFILLKSISFNTFTIHI
jgi:hypothetical protein